MVLDLEITVRHSLEEVLAQEVLWDHAAVGDRIPTTAHPLQLTVRIEARPCLISVIMFIRVFVFSLPSARSPFSFANADRTKTKNLPSP